MNSIKKGIKKVKLIISIIVLLGTLFSSQAIPVAIAQENVLLAVNGTLMRGLELEPNLVNLGATFVREDRTEPAYRLYSINDIHPAMVRVPPANATNGVSVAVEIWSVPADGVATLLEKEPPGLSIGKAKLQNGTVVLGVIAEPALVVGMKDISSYNGSFRDYIARTGMELIDNATQSSSNLTAEQLDAVKQLRIEGELLYNNNQLRGSIDSLNTAVKMLGLKDRLYLNIPLGYTAP
jgi:Allophanate hydrolase C-terminal domain